MLSQHYLKNSNQDQQDLFNGASAQQQNKMAFSEMLNKKLVEAATFHQIKEKINVQQIMRELNDKGLNAKEMSTDYFLDSLFKRKEKQEADVEGEVIDSDQNDMDFRRMENEGDSEEMMMDDQDTTDMEFDDHWGVERKGE